MRFQEEVKISQKGLRIGDDGIAEKNDAEASELQRSAKRRGCLLSYSQAEPGRELTQPRKHLLAEPCSEAEKKVTCH